VRVVVLGAGFAGLELTTRLSAVAVNEPELELDVVLVDRSDAFVFGFSKLDVMFGRTTAEQVRHRYADLVKPHVRFVQTAIRSIDPTARHVETDAGGFDADVLVIGLGADLDPSATPGLVEGGHEFYTNAGAFAVRDVLDAFDGGRAIVAVTSTPFKCPPAPSETALLLHDFLVERGLRDRSSIDVVMPMGVPIPPSPEASKAVLASFEARGIGWHGNALVRDLDAERKVARMADGTELPYDLFLGVPVHRAPSVVVDAGLTVDGWIPVDPRTLETSFPDVYAAGDVTSVGTPKAGVFAEGQAAVVAAHLVARARGAASDASYDGRGICYLEFGDDQVAKVDVTFLSGQAPAGDLIGPSRDLAADKADFGASRVDRWFGRDWNLSPLAR
jgi:sulfide:quinone oxidoreductase